MRHAIIVVGSKKQRKESCPDLVLRDDKRLPVSMWFARANQQESAQLLDDIGNVFVRLLLAPVLAYRFYLHVQNTKLWSGKRPLVLVRGRSFSSRVAAYAGSWGGGDVVKADRTAAVPLAPTRFVLTADGKLELHGREKRS